MNAPEPHYRRILREELSRRVSRNPRYSVRSFARNLGLDSGALSQILAGSRVPSERVSQKLMAALDLSPGDRDAFLHSLAQTHESRRLKRMSRYFKAISKELKARPAQIASRDLGPELFRTISDWYHYAILELTFTSGFRSDPAWIASELGISINEAILAIGRLKELGFLDEVDGKLVKTSPPLATADRSVTTAAHKRRQKQILEKAIGAVDSVPIELRNNSAMTMAINVTKIPEARSKIQSFLEEMSQFLECGERQKVYELAVCLFPLQSSKS